MIRLLLLFIVLTTQVPVLAQTTNDVKLTEFIADIQQWNKDNNKMTLSWWIPKEYWKIASADNKLVQPEVIEQLTDTFEDYVFIWACDLKIGFDGTMTFTEESEIRKTIKLIDNKGMEYTPLLDNQIEGMTLTIAENMKPLFSQALGQMGRGLHYYFFKVTDKENLISASNPGGFKIIHSNSEFKWVTPLATLLPSKFCKVDNGKMKGNWLYCPMHGTKLDE